MNDVKSECQAIFFYSHLNIFCHAHITVGKISDKNVSIITNNTILSILSLIPTSDLSNGGPR